MAGKKFIVFLITFFGVCSILTADSVNSAMVERDPFLCPTVRKVHAEYISIGMMGKTAGIDLKKINENWDKLQKKLLRTEEINYKAFHSQIL